MKSVESKYLNRQKLCKLLLEWNLHTIDVLKNRKKILKQSIRNNMKFLINFMCFSQDVRKMSSLNQEIEHCVRRKIGWAQLPQHIQAIFRYQSREFDNFILQYSVRNQLRWRGNLGKNFSLFIFFYDKSKLFLL